MTINQIPNTNNHFIAGDWGTSNLRLYLCQYIHTGSSILETRYGQGISEINDDFEDKFFSLTQEWFDLHGPMPVLLSGMIGSNIGWKEAPYLSCPVTAADISDGRISFTARDVAFSILAGLRTSNPIGSPDIMRGEELQLLGWLRANSQADNNAKRLFALPGTHNKWVLSENGKIENFLTAFTGELFALLKRDSILITGDSALGFNQEAFMQGVNAIQNLGGAQLVHALFSTRSKQVLGDIANSDGVAYLSGLIIAADVRGAIDLFGSDGSLPLAVTIIGEQALSKQYSLVLNHFGFQAEMCDPSDIAIAGFETIYQHLYAG